MHRRAALASALSAAAATAAAVARPAAAQEAAAGDLAGHPLVGTWAVTTPGGVVPQIHAPDGSVVVAFPPNYVDPALGLTFQGTALGRWEADGDRIGRFTALQALSDADGAYVGTFLLAAAVGDRLPRPALLRGGLLLTALPLGFLAALPPLPLAVAALALAGLGSGPVNPLVFTVLQERVPAQVRGRVFGVVMGTALAAAPVGMAGAGLLIEAAGLPATLALVAAGFLVVAGVTFAAPAFQDLGPPKTDSA